MQHARGDIDTRAAVAIILLVIAGIAYWQFAPHGWPFFHRRELPADTALPRDAGGASPSSAHAAANPPLYKWKDESGQWHITDEPPADRPFEKVVVDPNANVVPTIIPEVPGATDRPSTSAPDKH